MTKRISHISLAAVLCAAGAAQTGAESPLFQIGDSFSLYFDGRAEYRYQTNIFLEDDVAFALDPVSNTIVLADNDEQEDSIYIFSPGIELRLGKPGAKGGISFKASETFYRYNDLEELNIQTTSLELGTTYRTPKLSLTATGRWHELNQNEAVFSTVPDRILTREITNLNSDVEYQFSEKLSFGIGPDYRKEIFLNADYVNFANQVVRDNRDRESVSFPVDLYYKYSPKLSFSIGYRYRAEDVKELATDVDSLDATDHYFNVGARGEIAPKLTTRLRVGYQTREYADDARSSGGSFTMLSDWEWQPTEKLGFRATLNRDYRSVADGSSLVDTGGQLSASYSPLMRLTATAAIDYSNREYDYDALGVTDRTDDVLAGSLYLNYLVHDYVRLSAGYVYQTNDSNRVSLDYENHIFNFSAALRY